MTDFTLTMMDGEGDYAELCIKMMNFAFKMIGEGEFLRAIGLARRLLGDDV